MTKEQLQALSLSALLIVYNAHAKAQDDNLVLKFADKKSALRRVETIIAKSQSMGIKVGKIDLGEESVGAAGKKAPGKAAPKTPGTKTHADRAVAVAKSWKDPKVKAARSARHSVKVNGKEYKSVKAAFDALGLPLTGVIKFRMELKAAKNGLTAHGMKWLAVEV